MSENASLIILVCAGLIAFFSRTARGEKYYISDDIPFLPSNTPELYCNSNTCNDLSCIYNRKLTQRTGAYQSGRQETLYCGGTAVHVIWPQAYLNTRYTLNCWTYRSITKSFDIVELHVTRRQGSLSCRYDNKPCPVLSQTDDVVTVIAGPFIGCYPWNYSPNDYSNFEPSKALEVLCFSKLSCPDGPCRYNASFLSPQEEVKYSGGVKVLASCGSLKALITCPQFEDERVICSDIRKCYTYRSYNRSFKVLEVVVNSMSTIMSTSNPTTAAPPTTPEATMTHEATRTPEPRTTSETTTAPEPTTTPEPPTTAYLPWTGPYLFTEHPEVAANMWKVECKMEGKNCPVFRKNVNLSGFVLGMPELCFPFVKSESTLGVYLPSKYPDLICSTSDSHINGPERYKAELVSSFDSTYSQGAKVVFNCRDMQGVMRCPNVTDASSMCTESRKCYIYKSNYGSFSVLEIILKKPTGAAMDDVYCKSGNSNCPIFKETESKVIFVLGFRNSCFPEIKY